MDENFRFIQILDDLKQRRIIPDYVQAAKDLGTNKAGISDIKSGRKKLSIDILRRMKESYHEVNIEWIITGEGGMYTTTQVSTTTPHDIQPFIEKIAEQSEEIGRLKERIKQLERAKDNAASDAIDSMVANAG